VAFRRQPDSDYAVTLAFPASTHSGRIGLLDMPSSSQFRKQLFPDSADVEAPAGDIPLYPNAACKTQVGLSTACFVGFYLTPDGIEAVRSFYVHVLGRLGWQRIPTDSTGHLETFVKRGEDRTVMVQLREEDATTTCIGLVAMGRVY
jgi:hypothetical protein